MAQDILSDEFAREAAAAGSEARKRALDAGLAVPSYDETKGEFYIDQNGRRFLAEFVDGEFRAVREVQGVDAT